MYKESKECATKRAGALVNEMKIKCPSSLNPILLIGGMHRNCIWKRCMRYRRCDPQDPSHQGCAPVSRTHCVRLCFQIWNSRAHDRQRCKFYYLTIGLVPIILRVAIESHWCAGHWLRRDGRIWWDWPDRPGGNRIYSHWQLWMAILRLKALRKGLFMCLYFLVPFLLISPFFWTTFSSYFPFFFHLCTQTRLT